MEVGLLVPDILPCHCLNKYSPIGVATNDTLEPFSYELDGGETDPPLAGVTETVSFCWIISFVQEIKQMKDKINRARLNIGLM
jgi:hypothetical protein